MPKIPVSLALGPVSARAACTGQCCITALLQSGALVRGQLRTDFLMLQSVSCMSPFLTDLSAMQHARHNNVTYIFDRANSHAR